MKPIFQKNLQFGDIWPRNRQKIAQIEVYGHFLDFEWLVFLDFAHRWAWCLVAFLQLVGPVNVFLLLKLKGKTACFEHDIFHNNLKDKGYRQVFPYKYCTFLQNKNISQNFFLGGDNFTSKNFKKLSLVEWFFKLNQNCSIQTRTLQNSVTCNFIRLFWNSCAKIFGKLSEKRMSGVSF